MSHGESPFIFRRADEREEMTGGRRLVDRFHSPVRYLFTKKAGAGFVEWSKGFRAGEVAIKLIV